MKNIMNWATANKIATVFTIVGGFFLLYQLYSEFFSLRSKFSSEILIQEIKAPLRLQNYSSNKDIEELLPMYFDNYDLARLITDSLPSPSGISNLEYRDQLIELIPDNLSKRQIIKNIDSLIVSIISPLKADYFIETCITNIGNKTASDLRFEIPTYGYYELYDNNELRQNGEFKNFISIGELRVGNSSSIRIWTPDILVNFYNKGPMRTKYTFDEGLIYPRTTEVVISEGVLFWLFKNPFFSLYLFALFLWIILPPVFHYFKIIKAHDSA